MKAGALDENRGACHDTVRKGLRKKDERWKILVLGWFRLSWGGLSW